MNKTAISCIILAGGEARRFNREDKGLVVFNNKPLIEHVYDQIYPQVDDIIISANRNVDLYKKYSTKVVKDVTDDFQGPLSGIAACLPECDHEWVLVLPCDVPLLPDNLVEKLSSTDNKQLIVAKAHEQRQLIFLMHASLKSNLDDYLSQGHQKAMSWIDLQSPEIVEFDYKDSTFLNINTPEELNAL